MVLLVFLLLVDSSYVVYPDIMLNDCTPSLVHTLFSSILLMPSVLVPDSGPQLLVVKILHTTLKYCLLIIHLLFFGTGRQLDQTEFIVSWR